ncbi:MAG: hypothetical protein WCE57_05140, partial [Salegentibacter sp.]
MNYLLLERVDYFLCIYKKTDPSSGSVFFTEVFEEMDQENSFRFTSGSKRGARKSIHTKPAQCESFGLG